MKTKTLSKKRPGSGKKRGILVKGQWKTVKIDPSIFADEAMGEVVVFEELTDYSLVESNKTVDVSKLLQESVGKKKRKNNKRKAREMEDEEDILDEEYAEQSSDDDNVEQVDIVEKPAKKRKKKKNKTKGKTVEGIESQGTSEGLSSLAKEDDQIQEQSEESCSVTILKSGKKKKAKKQKSATEQAMLSSQVTETDAQVNPVGKSKRKGKNWTDAALSNSTALDSDVSAWKDLFVPELVLKALSKLGFSAPTPIQALALPPAIRDHMDILGAAETGSGKTLSFGIPMIHTILEWKKSIHAKNGDLSTGESIESGVDQADEEMPDIVQEDGKTEEVEGIMLEATEDGDEMAGEEEEEEEDGEQQSQDDDLATNESVVQSLDIETKGTEKQDGEKRPLLGLVLTPTRELAVQVQHHIDAVAQFTGIKTAVLVGGMAPQKQDRVLKRRPEIVIATPGRLWEMIQDRHPHLRNLRQLRCLVIDEADRMVEKGHFVELEKLLEMLSTSQFNPKRQTFVFSATLTMVHSLPSRLSRKKGKQLEQRSKLELLMEKVGIKNKPKIIDLSRKEATVETLTETKIHCEKEEKDFYLYYFLLQYPGRTMVFANSIDCIKRLTSLLTILDCNPLPLHANMHQKQRLKNLERFAERESCVLLTTDVAARGLDIPNVQHVLHYQVSDTPRPCEHCRRCLFFK